jgi:hypothetical protein
LDEDRSKEDRSKKMDQKKKDEKAIDREKNIVDGERVSMT